MSRKSVVSHILSIHDKFKKMEPADIENPRATKEMYDKNKEI